MTLSWTESIQLHTLIIIFRGISPFFWQHTVRMPWPPEWLPQRCCCYQCCVDETTSLSAANPKPGCKRIWNQCCLHHNTWLLHLIHRNHERRKRFAMTSIWPILMTHDPFWKRGTFPTHCKATQSYIWQLFKLQCRGTKTHRLFRHRRLFSINIQSLVSMTSWVCSDQTWNHHGQLVWSHHQAIIVGVVVSNSLRIQQVPQIMCIFYIHTTYTSASMPLLSSNGKHHTLRSSL